MELLKRKAVSVLRASEHYVKTDMVYIVKGGFWLILGQVLAGATALALSIIVDRYVGKDIYGSYKYVTSVTAILGTLTLTGVGTIVVREVARGNTSIVRWAFWTSARYALIPTAATLAFAGYQLFLNNTLLALSFAIVSLTFPLSTASGLYQAYLAGVKDFKGSALYWAYASTATAVCTALAMIYNGGLIAIISTATIAGALTSYCAYRVCTRSLTTESNDSHASHTGFAWHLSGMTLLSTMSANADKIIIFHFLGPVSAAIYVFAMAIPEQIRALFKIGARMALPKLAERSYDEIRKTLPRKIASGVVVGIVCVGAYGLMAEYIYAFLFPSYTEAVVYSRFLAITSIFVLGQVAVATFQAHGKTRTLYKYSAVADVFQICVSLALVPIYGLWGAVVSTVCGRGIAFIYSLVLLRRS